MDLKDKLIKIPKRENAGGRTSNRFAYQIYWALFKLLQLVELDNDFMLVMEFIDDVIILDSSNDPHYIDFYQVKTNDKKDVLYNSTSYLTATSKNKSMSFAEKLIDNMNRYPNETRSLHFVSDKFYNFELKNMGANSKDEWTILLEDIGDVDLKKLKKKICTSCYYKNNCKNNCYKIVHFDVSELDIITYQDTMFGRFTNFLNDKYGKGDISNTKAMFNTILSEIMRINNNEKKAANFSELITAKSITKDKFNGFLREFEKSFLMKDDWIDISNALRSAEENYNSIEILKIKKQWDKYKLDMLNADSPVGARIKADIRALILSKEFNSYRQCIDYVHTEISNEDYYKKELYPSEYFTAMILGEMYYAEVT